MSSSSLLFIFLACVGLAFGGTAGSGFYRVRQTDDGFATFVDPAGHDTLFLGTDHVTWASNTVSRLKAWGFNVSGAAEAAKPRDVDFPWVRNLKLGAGLADGRDTERYLGENLHRPGTAFPNVFRADFEEEAFRLARKKCHPFRNDPRLVGYFLDNELAWHARNRGTTRPWGVYEAARLKPEGHSAHKALASFLAAHGLKIGDAVPMDVRMEFVRLAAHRYFDVLTRAVRAADPNHLILGCRFAGADHPECVWEEAGRYCDVVSVNLYPSVDFARGIVWGGGRPLAETLTACQAWAKRPLIVTEWSYPSLDAGFSNNGGAGQRVLTQRVRAEASELFARTILALPFMAGYSYFKWSDPKPGSRQMTNYGLLRADGTPWPELTEMFARLQTPESLAQARHAALPRERAVAREIPFAGEKAAPATFTAAGADAAWTFAMADGLTVSGRLGATRGAIAAVSCRGKVYCTIEPMLRVMTGEENPKIREGERTVFPRIGHVRSAERVDHDGRSACRIVGSGKVGEQAFEMTVVLTPLAETGTLLVEIAAIENLSSSPLRAMSALICPMAKDMPVLHAPKPPYGYGECVRGSFASKDGVRKLTVAVDSAALRKMTFGFDRSGTLHPDIAFAPFCARRKMLFLAPGECYRPRCPFALKLLIL